MHGGNSFTKACVRKSDDFIDVSSFFDDELYLRKDTGDLMGFGTYSGGGIDPGDYFAVCIIHEVDPNEEIVDGIRP